MVDKKVKKHLRGRDYAEVCRKVVEEAGGSIELDAAIQAAIKKQPLATKNPENTWKHYFIHRTPELVSSKKQGKVIIYSVGQQQTLPGMGGSQVVKADEANGYLKALIPATCKEYIVRKMGNGMSDVDVMLAAHDKKQNVLIIGETGTGKTHLARWVAYKAKLSYVRINLNRMTTVEDFVGQWVPTAEGNFKWQDGVLTRLMRYGGLLVVDEINACPPELLFCLHGVLDDERKIVLTQKDGEVVFAHPEFWLVATMNPDYEGTKPLNEALKDRFSVVLNYDYDKRVERQLIKDAKLLELASKLRAMYISPQHEILTPVSTRMLMQYEENLATYGYILAREFFLNKFDPTERKAVESVMELHLGKTEEDKEAKRQAK